MAVHKIEEMFDATKFRTFCGKHGALTEDEMVGVDISGTHFFIATVELKPTCKRCVNKQATP